MDRTDAPYSAPLIAALATDIRLMAGRLKRRLREKGHFGDLTWPQLGVLGQIERDGPKTITALAKGEHVRPQSMGATVASLEDAGMLIGTPHPTDGRQTIFSLTPVCTALIATSRAAREDWLGQAIQKQLSPREQAELVQGIALLQRVIEG